MDVQPRIFNIQRWSLHDGPGIRTTLFFKGCPLRCRWCCNPESWALDSLSGQIETAPEKAMETILRDAVFYRASGGGVTFSGGEPFMHPVLLANLAGAAVDAGIDTAAETSGFFDLDAAGPALEAIDHLFIDIKCMDDARHKTLTRVSNQRILENIRGVDKAAKPMVIRMPLVQGLNDLPEDIEAAARFCSRLTHLSGVELMPYHPLGEGKYTALGLDYDRSMTPPLPQALDRIVTRFKNAGIPAACSAPQTAPAPEKRSDQTG